MRNEQEPASQGRLLKNQSTGCAHAHSLSHHRDLTAECDASPWGHSTAGRRPHVWCSATGSMALHPLTHAGAENTRDPKILQPALAPRRESNSKNYPCCRAH
eukprot:Amastigsp_a846161_115.p2 type:complete len:102 gc:universal Amastigsp_a846161_115:409-104(-)